MFGLRPVTFAVHVPVVLLTVGVETVPPEQVIAQELSLSVSPVYVADTVNEVSVTELVDIVPVVVPATPDGAATITAMLLTAFTGVVKVLVLQLVFEVLSTMSVNALTPPYVAVTGLAVVAV